MRTSETHPLYIDALEVANGRLGLTICPGKAGDSLYGPGWARDLAMDIAAIRAWGPAHVLTLVETDEMARLGVPHLPDAMRAESFAWHHLPIRDLAALDGAGDAAWARLSPRLHAALERGQRVLVHCRGGVGRAGSIAALLLIERGMGRGGGHRPGARGAPQRCRDPRAGALSCRARRLDAGSARPCHPCRPSRRGHGRQPRRRDRVPAARDDPPPLPGRPGRPAAAPGPARRDHRRHPDDALHGRGADPGRGAGQRPGHRGAPRAVALARHAAAGRDDACGFAGN
ncbi:MAG: hypothetical protein CVT80_07720 [Alphaproteobacteria bacterium HGW-Alphaproteobacteria-2]|nr:MAG: hypothetical protein CVT80_07720 [Alphaproteobacteria bacterium HGW-Alphaproteobacteria-2]